MGYTYGVFSVCMHMCMRVFMSEYYVGIIVWFESVLCWLCFSKDTLATHSTIIMAWTYNVLKYITNTTGSEV